MTLYDRIATTWKGYENERQLYAAFGEDVTVICTNSSIRHLS